jgi:hypothetical protein
MGRYKAIGMRYLFLTLMLLSFNSFGEILDIKSAIKIAERFVLENGYTDTINIKFQEPLILESIERTSNRKELLNQRFNQLQRKALGAKLSEQSWFIAFDYSVFEAKKLCRVVILKLDGSEPYMAHQSGYRKYFLSTE